jgi:hypothetical protein
VTALDVRATGSLPGCYAGTLPAQASVTCTARVAVPGLVAAPQSMTVAGDEADLNLTNNAATVTAVVDSDGDGVVEAADNCRLARNGAGDAASSGAAQRDTNGDGYGNVCDADFNNSGWVDALDLALLRVALGSSRYPDRDLDGNGTVNATDLALFRTLYGKPPGPSGTRR